MMETHYQAVKKVLKIAESFVKKIPYLPRNWFYLELHLSVDNNGSSKFKFISERGSASKDSTAFLNCRQQKKLFLAEQIEERIYGNFKIAFVEERSRDSRISD